MINDFGGGYYSSANFCSTLMVSVSEKKDCSSNCITISKERGSRLFFLQLKVPFNRSPEWKYICFDPPKKWSYTKNLRGTLLGERAYYVAKSCCTCVDIDRVSEEEDGLFPVGGYFLRPSAQVQWILDTIKPDVKIPYKCLWTDMYRRCSMSMHALNMFYKYACFYVCFSIRIHPSSKSIL